MTDSILIVEKNAVIAGIKTQPQSISVSIAGKSYSAKQVSFSYENGALEITDLQDATSVGVWSGDVVIELKGQRQGGWSNGRNGSWGGGWCAVGWR